MEYVKSSKKTGWKGYRVIINNDDIKKYIKYKLIEIDKKFENLLIDEIFFHYILEENRNDLKKRLHKDTTDFAGVIYLTPNPPKNSGTTLHNDNTNLENVIDNVYNRFIFYDGKKLHGPQDTFGNSIENGRLTLTMFANISKNKKTII
jgi:hypothetical protein